jgi:hypothetical protein
VNRQGVAALLPVTDRKRLDAALAALPGGAGSPFAALANAHFTRLLVVKLEDEPGDHLLFGAEFDGSTRDFLDDVCRLEVDAVFGCCEAYPGRAKPAAFRRWILDHHVKAGFSIHGNPRPSVREIRESLELRERIAAFAVETRGLEPEAFAERWKAVWG